MNVTVCEMIVNGLQYGQFINTNFICSPEPSPRKSRGRKRLYSSKNDFLNEWEKTPPRKARKSFPSPVK